MGVTLLNPDSYRERVGLSAVSTLKSLGCRSYPSRKQADLTRFDNFQKVVKSKTQNIFLNIQQMKTKLLFLLPLFLILFSCSSNNDAITPEKVTLKSVTYEVIFFEYTPDTGKNSSRLRYEIKFTNPNNVAIKGVSIITKNIDGNIFKPIKRVPPYTEIAANSSYTESFDVESAFEPQYEKINSIKFVSAEFVLAIE